MLIKLDPITGAIIWEESISTAGNDLVTEFQVGPFGTILLGASFTSPFSLNEFSYSVGNQFLVQVESILGKPTFTSFSNLNLQGNTFKYREDPILLDPRNKNLGARLIINLEKLYLSLKKLNLQESNLKDYYSFSHKLGIVPKDFNKLQNKLFGIECNYEELNGIDFKKGCYVGQENTARIKLKNKLSKRLLPINIIKGELSEGETIYFNEKEIGKVLIEKDYPFALVKYLDESFNGKSDFNTKNALIKIEKPNWINT